ncbi:MAG: GIY-YIG nuclease family protein [Bowdeniella nasicola]|nr:GIY-YIG nuclease family protein [Bowdeniella nasicola]
MSQGKQVLLFLVDGRPGGLRTAEIVNWTGHVMATQRAGLKDLLRRVECARTGVYILLGTDASSEEPNTPLIYIGETDDISARLRQHSSKKAWWDRVVVVTSQADHQQLTKSNIRYLESRLLSRARELGRCTLDNDDQPDFTLLSEAEKSNMEYFLEQLYVLLPVVGVDIFRGIPSPSNAPRSSGDSGGVSPIFTLTGKRQGVCAQAKLVDGEFFVLQGSTAVPDVRISPELSKASTRQYRAIHKTHRTLVDTGALRSQGDHAVFTRDVPFSSPSAAGCVVLGRACNGRTSWVTADGQQFGTWEQQGI